MNSAQWPQSFVTKDPCSLKKTKSVRQIKTKQSFSWLGSIKMGLKQQRSCGGMSLDLSWSTVCFPQFCNLRLFQSVQTRFSNIIYPYKLGHLTTWTHWITVFFHEYMFFSPDGTRIFQHDNVRIHWPESMRRYFCTRVQTSVPKKIFGSGPLIPSSSQDLGEKKDLCNSFGFGFFVH